jgi:rhamnosyltransferase
MNNVLVLMTTYNGEKYLPEQINSILSQENVNVSILIRDDGSNDGTLKILKKFAKNKKIAWYQGNHCGPALGFMELIQHAGGADYYAFSDQDDFWLPSKLNEAIKKIDSKKNIPAIYYSSLNLVDQNLKFIKKHEINIKRSIYSNFIFSNVAGCTMVMNNKLISKLRYIPNSNIIMHDTWVYKVCVSIGGYVYPDKKSFILYRQHENNTIGIRDNLISKFKVMKLYLKPNVVQKQIKQLKNGYFQMMTPEFKYLVNAVCNYKKSIVIWKNLLTNHEIDFKNIYLNIIYKFKIFFFFL